MATVGFEISDDPGRLDRDLIHWFLASEAYWNTGIPREIVDRAIDNSLCFGAYRSDDGSQVAFARVVTDRATFAHLMDVFVVDRYRNLGLGKAIVAAAMAHLDLQDLRKFTLTTLDAHALYEPFGFALPAHPERQMEILRDAVVLYA